MSSKEANLSSVSWSTPLTRAQRTAGPRVRLRGVSRYSVSTAIPQMAIVTNIDAACAEIEKDLKNVYMSKHLKKKMTDFSSAVGIPMNCICPVKNYSQEIQINDEVDSLIVSALRLIIDFGDDFIDNMQTSPAGQ